MASSQNLVHYAAVAKGSVIIAEHAEGLADLPSMATKCLEQVPPLHSRFSYTTSNHMFICLIEGLFIYCAIMDEALSKAKAFMFLEHVRDAFKVLLQQRGSYAESLVPYSLDKEMSPFFRRLAAPLIGMPQKEKNRIEEELQAQRYVDIDLEVSSPSAVAPLHESDEDFDQTTEQKPLSSRSPRMSWIGIGKKEKKRLTEQLKEVKDIIVENNGKAATVESRAPLDVEYQEQNGGCLRNKGQQSAQIMWWRNVRLVIMLDVLVCLILLAIWLGVCSGVTCLKQHT